MDQEESKDLSYSAEARLIKPETPHAATSESMNSYNKRSIRPNGGFNKIQHEASPKVKSKGDHKPVNLDANNVVEWEEMEYAQAVSQKNTSRTSFVNKGASMFSAVANIGSSVTGSVTSLAKNMN
jgi:hypothetical protein